MPRVQEIRASSHHQYKYLRAGGMDKPGIKALCLLFFANAAG